MTPEQQQALAAALGRMGMTPEQMQALAAAQARTAPQPNPDGTYGQPPEGFIPNPQTGQMTSRELMANNMQPSVMDALAVSTPQGAFWGGSDEIAGAAGAAAVGSGGTAGERYDFNRERERAALEAARRDHPVASFAGEALGSMATGGAAAGGLRAGATQAAPKAVELISRLLGRNVVTRAAGGAAAGAAGAGTYGFASGEGGPGPRWDQALNAGKRGAGLGAGASLGGDAIAGYLGKRATNRTIREGAKGAPSSDDLLAEGQRLYGEVDAAGVAIRPERLAGVYDNIVDDLSGAGVGRKSVAMNRATSPYPSARMAYDTAKEAAEEARGANAGVPFRQADVDRRLFGNNAASAARTARAPGPGGGKDDVRLSTQAYSKLDDFISNIGPDDVTAGDAEALTSALEKARNVWGRMSRSQMIEDAVDQGEKYVSGAASGIRNQFSRILKDPNLSRGFTKTEIAAMERVVNSPTSSILANLGGGLGQVATTTAGGAAAGVGAGPFAILPGMAAGGIVGAGARKASEAYARRQAEVVRALIANRGNYQQITSNPNTKRVIEQLLRNTLTPTVSQ